jgi:YhgE/Pip-like protein
MELFKQKLAWFSLGIVLIVLVVFGAALMGSVAGSKPKNLPVALVVEDQPAQMPGGGALAVGEDLGGKLASNTELPVAWVRVDSEEEARTGLNNREYYGALVLPADLSRGLLSLAAPEPKPATVTVLVNEGMNTQASTLVRQMLNQAMNRASAELGGQLLKQIGQATGQIPVGTAQALLAPLMVKEEIVHPVGVNNAAGNAPGILAQLMWVGSLATAAILFLASRKPVLAGAKKWATAGAQAAFGAAIAGATSGFVVWMAASWYGMELASAGAVWLFLWLIGAAFFLLQSALLNWIGVPAMALLVLLMFFSMPLLNMAPELLSQGTKDWVYSWTPMRYAAVGLREVMYFGGWNAAERNAAVLWSIAGVFLVLLLASGFKKAKAAKEQSNIAAPVMNP